MGNHSNHSDTDQILNGSNTIDITSPTKHHPKETAMTERILPHENDILMGRGGKNNQHVGNEKLRGMARSQCESYRLSSKKGKSHISRDLVKRVRQLSPPGRFLKKNGISGEWEDVGDDIAREKASQVLRDAVAISMNCSSNTSEEELDKSMQKEEMSSEHRRSSSAPPVMAKSSTSGSRRRGWEEAAKEDRYYYDHHHHHEHRHDHHDLHYSSYPPHPCYSSPPPPFHPPPPPVTPTSSGHHHHTPKRRRYYRHPAQDWEDHRFFNRVESAPRAETTRSASFPGHHPMTSQGRDHETSNNPGLMGDVQSGLEEFDLFNGELLRSSSGEEEESYSPHDLHTNNTF